MCLWVHMGAMECKDVEVQENTVKGGRCACFSMGNNGQETEKVIMDGRGEQRGTRVKYWAIKGCLDQYEYQ